MFLAGSYDNKVSLAEFRGTPLATFERDIATAVELARNTHGIVPTQTTTWIYNQNINFLSSANISWVEK